MLFGFIIAAIIGSIILKLVDVSFRYKKCPWCKESIKMNAIACKHCGRNVQSKKTRNRKSINRDSPSHNKNAMSLQAMIDKRLEFDSSLKDKSDHDNFKTE